MNPPNSISTISEFLLHAKTQHIVIDMGRTIRKIDNQTFFEWESQQAPCLYPRQNHGWFCITFWNETTSNQHYIWFVKLPLDEQGFILQASQSHFLSIVAKALGSQLEYNTETERQIPENEYVFQPSQQQMADTHAYINKLLNHQPVNTSKVNAYMQQPLVCDWQTLSIQEIANYVMAIERSDQCHVQSVICKNLHDYPPAVLTSLFSSLENVSQNDKLSEALIAFHHSPKLPHIKTLCLRAMHSDGDIKVLDYIRKLVNSDDLRDIETCVVIAGRYWVIFEDMSYLTRFFEVVCELDQQFELFRGLYADLARLPDIRNNVLKFLRCENRSALVANAIGSLFMDK